MIRANRVLFFSLITCAVLLFSTTCTAGGNGVIAANGSMDISVNIEMLPAFADYLTDLQGASRAKNVTSPSKGLFDEVEIRTVLAKETGIKLKSLKVEPRIAQLDLQVLSLSDIANKGRLADYIDFRTVGGETILSFISGPKLVKALIAYVRPDAVKDLDSLIPKEGSKVTPAQYERDWLDTLADLPKEIELVTVNGKQKEKYLSFYTEAELKAMLAASKIVVQLKLPRPVRTVKGILKTGADTVRYEIGVLEVLTLQKDTPVEIRY